MSLHIKRSIEMELKKLSPGMMIAISFLLVILTGAIVLKLPISLNDGVEVSFIDTLFTSTSAVCVTGLIAVDTAETFNVFGRSVVALLIQVGGLGVTSIGVSIILVAGKRISFKQRHLVKEAWNVNTFKGIVKLVKAVLILTLSFELIGAILSFFAFRKYYPTVDAIGISVFHSIAAFNNSGFDILGGLQNLIPYKNDVLLNLTTCGLIIFGGLGFLVIIDVIKSKSIKKLSLHSKVVLIMTLILLVLGTLFLKSTENITWLGAFFQSTSARTAGFSTYSIGEFTDAGLFVLIALMFVGASPGSTGGGIKTSTLFVLIQAVRSVVTNQDCESFKRKIPYEAVSRAFIVTLLSLTVVIFGTFLLCILEPEYSFIQNLFETTSAFGTVGLSTGITPFLSGISKFVIIIIMYIGRLGPLSIASLCFIRESSNVHYVEEMISIG